MRSFPSFCFFSSLRRCPFVFLFMLGLFASLLPLSSAWAGAVRPEVYLQAKTSGAMLSWKDPLLFRLDANEALCRKMYQKNWVQICYAQVGERGAEAFGIELSPAVEGVWTWQGERELRFTPKESLTPGTAYTVKLKGLRLPSGFSLGLPANGKSGKESEKATLHVKTLPQAAEIRDHNVWIDPSPNGTHAVSCTIRFSWPAKPAEMEKRISLRPLEEGLVLGKPDFVWNQTRDEVTVNARITSLPKSGVPLEIGVKGLPELIPDRNGSGPEVNSGSDGKSLSRFIVPGREGLFQIKRLEIKESHNAGLDREYRLELETSLQTTPAAVMKALTLVALPKNVAPRGGKGQPEAEATRPYDWSNAPVVPPADLKRGADVKLEPLQAADELGSRLSFRLRVEPEAYLFAWFPAQFASPGGFSLGQPWKGVLKAERSGPGLHFLQPGHVLPLQGEGKIDIHSNGLTAIRWELSRVRDPFLAMLADRFYSGFAGTEADDGMTEVARGEVPLNRRARGEAQFTVLGVKDLDFSPPQEQTKDGKVQGAERGQASGPASGQTSGPAVGQAASRPAARYPGGLMQLRLTGMVDDNAQASASRLILVTDLGMFVKRASDGRRDVFVCSLSTGEPVAGALVRVLGRNGLPVAEAQSDAQGRASLPAVDGLERERQAVAIVALRPSAKAKDSGLASGLAEGEDFAWLSLQDASRAIDYSAFPTAGRSAASEGVAAYVFAQRGIFRPGETLRFGCLVRRGDWQPLPADLPLKAVLYDPAGNEVLSHSFTVAPDGLAELSWDSDESAMTGRYRLDVLLANSSRNADLVLGTGAVRVEDFQPDTLAMRLRVGPMGAAYGAGEAAGWFVTEESGRAAASAKAGKAAPSGGTSGESSGETGQMAAFVRLKNLHGLPAQNRRVRASLSVAPAQLSFAGYEDYIFHDASPFQGEALQENLPEVQTNSEGEAVLPLPFSRYRTGTMRANLLVEGFEPGGGRAVSEEKSFLLSPLRFVLGYRPGGEGTNLQYIPQGRKAVLDFVALDPELQRTDPGPLTFTLFERRYVTSLVKDNQGHYRYDETPVDKPLSRGEARFDAQKNLPWTLSTDRPGDYLLTVTVASASGPGTRLAQVPFTVAGNSLVLPEYPSQRRNGDGYEEEGEGQENWLYQGPPSIALAPGKLRLRMDKSDYAPGEEIQLFLSAPYKGTGLITLERDGVVAHRWFRAAAGDSVHSIVVPKTFEGRGYVNLAFVRAQDSPDIYMQPLSNALLPFTANLAARDLGLTLTAPQRARPGETVKVRLSSREAGRAVLFAVDEGVLQLTSFVTPSPLDALLRDRALDVTTIQGFDLLMPDHARLSGRLPAFGGDRGRIGGRFLNPFKRKSEPPLATWSGLVAVSPEGTELSFTVPDYYNGKVRIMAVGASADAAGNAEASLTVRGSVVLAPQVPVMAAPGDRFEASVGVSNALEPEAASESASAGTKGADTLSGKSAGTASRFRITVETEGGLRLVGEPPAPLSIKAGDEAVATFSLQAGELGVQGERGEQGEQGELGEAAVRIRAEVIGAEKTLFASRRVTLSLRPATPFRSESLSGITNEEAKGAQAENVTVVPVGRERYAYKRSDVFEASRAPLPALRGLVRRLDLYPYGCTEQLLSKAFPYVLLSSRPDLLIDGQRDAAAIGKTRDAFINAALRSLQASFQYGDYSGSGVSTWPGGTPDELLTVYAGDFLLALREAGRGTPANLENGIFDAIARQTERSPNSLNEGRIKAYGLWVLTREGRVTAQALEQLTQSLDGLSPQKGRGGWRSDVTGALMAASYAIMRMDDAATALMDDYDANYANFQSSSYLNPGAAASLYTTVLARYFPERLSPDAAQKEADAVLGSLRPYWGSSFNGAQGVRALLALADGAVAQNKDQNTAQNKDQNKDQNKGQAANPAAALTANLACAGGKSPAGQGKAMDVLPGLLRLEADCPAFALTTPKNERWYWLLTSSGYDKTPPAKAGGNGMSVEKLWRNAAGEVLKLDGQGRVKVSQGEEITVVISAKALGRELSDAVISDLLPGGFEMVLPALGAGKDEGKVTGDAGLTRAERREDRMLLFVDLDTSLRTWSYRIRAVNKGRFTLPPAQAEAMYDPALTAHTAAGVVEVD